YEALANRTDRFELISRFRNQLANLRWQVFAAINGNDAAQRRVQIRAENKHRSFVINEIVLGIRLVQQLNDFGIRIDEVFVKDAVLSFGTALHRNDEIAPIIGDFSVEEPFLLIGPLVDQSVL